MDQYIGSRYERRKYAKMKAGELSNTTIASDGNFVDGNSERRFRNYLFKQRFGSLPNYSELASLSGAERDQLYINSINEEAQQNNRVTNQMQQQPQVQSIVTNQMQNMTENAASDITRAVAVSDYYRANTDPTYNQPQDNSVRPPLAMDNFYEGVMFRPPVKTKRQAEAEDYADQITRLKGEAENLYKTTQQQLDEKYYDGMEFDPVLRKYKKKRNDVPMTPEDIAKARGLHYSAYAEEAAIDRVRSDYVRDNFRIKEESNPYLSIDSPRKFASILPTISDLFGRFYGNHIKDEDINYEELYDIVKDDLKNGYIPRAKTKVDKYIENILDQKQKAFKQTTVDGVTLRSSAGTLASTVAGSLVENLALGIETLVQPIVWLTAQGARIAGVDNWMDWKVAPQSFIHKISEDITNWGHDDAAVYGDDFGSILAKSGYTYGAIMSIGIPFVGQYATGLKFASALGKAVNGLSKVTHLDRVAQMQKLLSSENMASLTRAGVSGAFLAYNESRVDGFQNYEDVLRDGAYQKQDRIMEISMDPQKVLRDHNSSEAYTPSKDAISKILEQWTEDGTYENMKNLRLNEMMKRYGENTPTQEQLNKDIQETLRNVEKEMFDRAYKMAWAENIFNVFESDDFDSVIRTEANDAYNRSVLHQTPIIWLPDAMFGGMTSRLVSGTKLFKTAMNLVGDKKWMQFIGNTVIGSAKMASIEAGTEMFQNFDDELNKMIASNNISNYANSLRFGDGAEVVAELHMGYLEGLQNLSIEAAQSADLWSTAKETILTTLLFGGAHIPGTGKTRQQIEATNNTRIGKTFDYIRKISPIHTGVGNVMQDEKSQFDYLVGTQNAYIKYLNDDDEIKNAQNLAALWHSQLEANKDIHDNNKPKYYLDAIKSMVTEAILIENYLAGRKNDYSTTNLAKNRLEDFIDQAKIRQHSDEEKANAVQKFRTQSNIQSLQDLSDSEIIDLLADSAQEFLDVYEQVETSASKIREDKRLGDFEDIRPYVFADVLLSRIPDEINDLHRAIERAVPHKIENEIEDGVKTNYADAYRTVINVLLEHNEKFKDVYNSKNEKRKNKLLNKISQIIEDIYDNDFRSENYKDRQKFKEDYRKSADAPLFNAILPILRNVLASKDPSINDSYMAEDLLSKTLINIQEEFNQMYENILFNEGTLDKKRAKRFQQIEKKYKGMFLDKDKRMFLYRLGSVKDDIGALVNVIQSQEGFKEEIIDETIQSSIKSNPDSTQNLGEAYRIYKISKALKSSITSMLNDETDRQRLSEIIDRTARSVESSEEMFDETQYDIIKNPVIEQVLVDAIQSVKNINFNTFVDISNVPAQSNEDSDGKDPDETIIAKQNFPNKGDGDKAGKSEEEYKKEQFEKSKQELKEAEDPIAIANAMQSFLMFMPSDKTKEDQELFDNAKKKLENEGYRFENLYSKPFDKDLDGDFTFEIKDDLMNDSYISSVKRAKVIKRDGDSESVVQKPKAVVQLSVRYAAKLAREGHVEIQKEFEKIGVEWQTEDDILSTYNLRKYMGERFDKFSDEYDKFISELEDLESKSGFSDSENGVNTQIVDSLNNAKKHAEELIKNATGLAKYFKGEKDLHLDNLNENYKKIIDYLNKIQNLKNEGEKPVLELNKKQEKLVNDMILLAGILTNRESKAAIKMQKNKLDVPKDFKPPITIRMASKIKNIVETLLPFIHGNAMFKMNLNESQIESFDKILGYYKMADAIVENHKKKSIDKSIAEQINDFVAKELKKKRKVGKETLVSKIANKFWSEELKGKYNNIDTIDDFKPFIRDHLFTFDGHIDFTRSIEEVLEDNSRIFIGDKTIRDYERDVKNEYNIKNLSDYIDRGIASDDEVLHYTVLSVLGNRKIYPFDAEGKSIDKNFFVRSPRLSPYVTLKQPFGNYDDKGYRYGTLVDDIKDKLGNKYSLNDIHSKIAEIIGSRQRVTASQYAEDAANRFIFSMAEKNMRHNDMYSIYTSAIDARNYDSQSKSSIYKDIEKDYDKFLSEIPYEDVEPISNESEDDDVLDPNDYYVVNVMFNSPDSMGIYSFLLKKPSKAEVYSWFAMSMPDRDGNPENVYAQIISPIIEAKDWKPTNDPRRPNLPKSLNDLKILDDSFLVKTKAQKTLYFNCPKSKRGYSNTVINSSLTVSSYMQGNEKTKEAYSEVMSVLEIGRANEYISKGYLKKGDKVAFVFGSYPNPQNPISIRDGKEVENRLPVLYVVLAEENDNVDSEFFGKHQVIGALDTTKAEGELSELIDQLNESAGSISVEEGWFSDVILPTGKFEGLSITQIDDNNTILTKSIKNSSEEGFDMLLDNTRLDKILDKKDDKFGIQRAEGFFEVQAVQRIEYGANKSKNGIHFTDPNMKESDIKDDKALSGEGKKFAPNTMTMVLKCNDGLNATVPIYVIDKKNNSEEKFNNAILNNLKGKYISHLKKSFIEAIRRNSTGLINGKTTTLSIFDISKYFYCLYNDSVVSLVSMRTSDGIRIKWQIVKNNRIQTLEGEIVLKRSGIDLIDESTGSIVTDEMLDNMIEGLITTAVENGYIQSLPHDITYWEGSPELFQYAISDGFIYAPNAHVGDLDSEDEDKKNILGGRIRIVGSNYKIGLTENAGAKKEKKKKPQIKKIEKPANVKVDGSNANRAGTLDFIDESGSPANADDLAGKANDAIVEPEKKPIEPAEKAEDIDDLLGETVQRRRRVNSKVSSKKRNVVKNTSDVEKSYVDNVAADVSSMSYEELSQKYENVANIKREQWDDLANDDKINNIICGKHI